MGCYDSARSFYYTWGSHFKGRYDKIIAYGIITSLSFFSMLDTFLMWANYDDLMSEDYRYALVTGHPGNLAVNALFALSVFSSAFCIIECVNILSMMTNGGHTRLPVELEQAVILVCTGIPTGAVNLSIIMCRHGDATAYQMIGGLVTLVKSALRMYFYGWLKESKFKYERTMYRWTLKIAIYMTATSTWLMVFVIQCFAWHHGNTGGIHSADTSTTRLHAMDGISVLLVSSHDFDHDDQSRHIGSYFTHRIRYCAGANQISFLNDTSDETWIRPVLVTNLSDIMESTGGQSVIYGCPDDNSNINNNTFVLTPCQNDTSLLFRFRYGQGSYRKRHQPYGEIRYNIATLTDNRCRHLRRPLLRDWELHYFRIIPNRRLANDTDDAKQSDGYPDDNGCESARLEQAWVQDCFPPVPHYDPRLDVCGYFNPG